MNQREIKFRAWGVAWGEKEPQMWNENNVAVLGNATMLYGGHNTVDSVYNLKEFPDLKVMQYTGLKDKNGKEIYDGDICTFWWNPIFNEPSTLFELKAPVMFYDKWSSFCFEIRKAQSSGKQLEIFDELGDADLYVAVGSPITHGEADYGVEVIGNIYENPNLLPHPQHPL